MAYLDIHALPSPFPALYTVYLLIWFAWVVIKEVLSDGCRGDVFFVKEIYFPDPIVMASILQALVLSTMPLALTMFMLVIFSNASEAWFLRQRTR